MRATLFLVATLASLFSLATTLPLELSAIESRDYIASPSFDIGTGGYKELDLDDLAHRSIIDRDILDVGSLVSLEARAGKVGRVAPAKVVAPAKGGAPLKAAGLGKNAPKREKFTACRKRDESCLNVFVVWYQEPNLPRHWGLYLTSATAVTGSTGTIYQVRDLSGGHGSQFYTHIKPTVSPTNAPNYEAQK